MMARLPFSCCTLGTALASLVAIVAELTASKAPRSSNRLPASALPDVTILVLVVLREH